jgi:hypothetical protein
LFHILIEFAEHFRRKYKQGEKRGGGALDRPHISETAFALFLTFLSPFTAFKEASAFLKVCS